MLVSRTWGNGGSGREVKERRVLEKAGATNRKLETVTQLTKNSQ